MLQRKMPEPEQSRRPIRSRDSTWIRNLAIHLGRRGITPNQISVGGIVLALVAFAIMCVGGVTDGKGIGMAFICALSALCVFGRLLCNLLDGLVAVEGGLKGKAGDLFNELPDRIEDTLFLAGAGCLCGAPALGWACAAFAAITAYVRALGASLGQGQDFSGPCAKPHRMGILIGGLVATGICAAVNVKTPILPATLWIIAIGTLATIGLRAWRLYQKLP